MLNRLLAFPVTAVALSACVTINIYFPAAAAEEAARTIVRDVLQGEEPPSTPAPEKGDQSATDTLSGTLLVLAGHVLHRLVPPAHAAEADININTSAIRAIRARLERRQSELQPFYRSGAIGFDNRGNVAVRDLNAAPMQDRNRLRKLVADENADRDKLYAEIARANGHPEWAGQVRDTFAKVWVQESPRGYWYQDGGGRWQQR
jgi:uncharacterized protein YdbL (DUF1318 family)